MNFSDRYDDLIMRTDALLLKHNPCQWNDSTKDCIRGTHGCCGSCPNLTETGCIIQSLACKLWICPHVSATMSEEAIAEFKAVWDEAIEYNLLTFRGSKELSVKNAKYCKRTKEIKCVCVNKYGDPSWVLG